MVLITGFSNLRADACPAVFAVVGLRLATLAVHSSEPRYVRFHSKVALLPRAIGATYCKTTGTLAGHITAATQIHVDIEKAICLLDNENLKPDVLQ